MAAFTQQVVVVKLGNEEYGFDIGNVQEIKEVVPVTRVPGAPAHILGVFNLRGRIVPLVDLAELLQLRKVRGPAGGAAPAVTDAEAPVAAGAERRIVVVEGDGHSAGFLVDGVRETLVFSSSQVEWVGETAANLGGFAAGAAGAAGAGAAAGAAPGGLALTDDAAGASSSAGSSGALVRGVIKHQGRMILWLDASLLVGQA